MKSPSRFPWEMVLLAVAVSGLAAGGLVQLLAGPFAARWIWAAVAVVVLVPTMLSAVRGLWRRETSVDLIAVLAMGGALALGEYLAGAIIAVIPLVILLLFFQKHLVRGLTAGAVKG